MDASGAGAGAIRNSAVPMSRIGLNDHKAGMKGLDKHKINQIIVEASKGSKYYENEVKKEQTVTKKIETMVANLQRLTTAQKSASQQAMDREVDRLERDRVLGRVVVHADMDAFYAAVEMRDNPALRDVPMAVGSQAMLSTSNYAARRFGVRAAMPGFIARKLCPRLVIVGTNFDKYRAVCKEVHSVLARYDPQFCPMGLDESYLDITDYVLKKYHIKKQNDGTQQDSHTPPPSEQDSDDLCTPPDGPLSAAHWEIAASVVAEIRSQITMVTGLTASAGIAPNMMLAKVASDMNKPDGQFLVEPTREGVLGFVRQLPIRKICGIGKVTERLLQGLGVTTCNHLYQQRATLNLLFSSTTSQHFLRIAMAIGDTNVHSYGNSQRKSLSTERTFAELSKESDLLCKCRELCVCLAEEMMREGIAGRTVTLKIKTITFEVRSRSETLPCHVTSCDDIYRTASQLLRAEMAAASPTPLRLRLMGVRVSTLQRIGTDNTLQRTSADNMLQRTSTDNMLQRTSTDSTLQRTSTDNMLQRTSADNTLQCTSTDSTLQRTSTDNTLQRTGTDNTLQRTGTDNTMKLTHFFHSQHHHPTTDPTTDPLSTIEPPKEVTDCPVCGRQIPTSDNTVLNRHLDDCLSLTTIQETAAARKRLLNSPASSPNKRQYCVKPLEAFWT